MTFVEEIFVLEIFFRPKFCLTLNTLDPKFLEPHNTSVIQLTYLNLSKRKTKLNFELGTTSATACPILGRNSDFREKSGILELEMSHPGYELLVP